MAEYADIFNPTTPCINKIIEVLLYQKLVWK